LSIALIAGGVLAGTAGAAASPEAKEACKELKDKIKKKDGNAKKKAKRKYKRCLKDYDEANPPTPPVPPNPNPDPPAQQCTTLDNCPALTRNDSAGQQAFGGEQLLERYSFGSSGQTAEYHRLFFFGNGLYRGYAVDWNSVSGEICRDGSLQQGNWSFKAGYTYTDNGGGALVELAMTIGGQAGTQIIDFPAGKGYVYVLVGSQWIQFEKNPNMRDQC
jgi:hypothetical protein